MFLREYRDCPHSQRVRELIPMCLHYQSYTPFDSLLQSYTVLSILALLSVYTNYAHHSYLFFILISSVTGLGFLFISIESSTCPVRANVAKSTNEENDQLLRILRRKTTAETTRRKEYKQRARSVNQLVMTLADSGIGHNRQIMANIDDFRQTKMTNADDY